MKLLKKITVSVARIAAAVALILLIAYLLLNKSLPEGKAGPEADKLARAVWEAARPQGWKKTGAILWSFRGRNQHVWDRKRHFARVTWGEGTQQTVATLSLRAPSKGVVTVGGIERTNAERAALLKQAYARWANDSFWLNPLEKFFDPGVQRKIVQQDGKKMLLITFSKGGVTPGDSYLFEIGPNNLPVRWWMWASILPLGGIKASFEGWTTLPTGAKVSTKHTLPVGAVTFPELKAAKDVKTLLGKDPFYLLERRFPGI